MIKEAEKINSNNTMHCKIDEGVDPMVTSSQNESDIRGQSPTKKDVISDMMTPKDLNHLQAHYFSRLTGTLGSDAGSGP